MGVNHTVEIFLKTHLLFRHGQSPTLLVHLADRVSQLICLLLLLADHRSQLLPLPLQLRKPFLSLMKNGLLCLQDWSALFEGGDDIHVPADFSLFQQRQHTLLQFLSLDSIPLMQRV
jgi:hypothetical protein